MMKKLMLKMFPLMMVLFFWAGAIYAADEMPAKESVQTKQQMFGSQLMTKQERMEQRKRMRAAKSAEERAQIQNEYHERMKLRAKERGVSIPDEPLNKGGGMGSGAGQGRGFGAGQGRGAGQSGGK
jgi:hypothetical protein